MNPGDALREAWGALRAQRLRSVLTALGIATAIVGLLGITGSVRLVDLYVRARLEWLFGTQRISVSRVAQVRNRADWERLRARRPLGARELAQARRACPDCRAGAQALAPLAARAAGREVEVLARGVDDGLLELLPHLRVVAGRPLLPGDQRAGAAVAVIGADVAEGLFGPGEGVGRSLLVGDVPLRVVGVLERLGSAFDVAQDNGVLVPLERFQSHFEGELVLELEAPPGQDVGAVLEPLRHALRLARDLRSGDPDDFELVTRDEARQGYDSLVAVSYLMALLVSGIGLVIAAVVASNVFLMSVSERTLEIGMRRAVGARRRDVLRASLAESLMLSWGAAALALLLADALAGALAPLVASALRDAGAGLGQVDDLVPRAFDPLSAAPLAFAFATAVGLAAGVYPALRAAGLRVTDALAREG